MTTGFDLVAVRIKNERAVIIGVIMRPEPRLAVIGAAGGHGRSMESIDIGTPLRGKSEMHAALAIDLGTQRVRHADPERCAFILLAIAMGDQALTGNVDVARADIAEA